MKPNFGYLFDKKEYDQFIQFIIANEIELKNLYPSIKISKDKFFNYEHLKKQPISCFAPLSGDKVYIQAYIEPSHLALIKLSLGIDPNHIKDDLDLGDSVVYELPDDLIIDGFFIPSDFMSYEQAIKYIGKNCEFELQRKYKNWGEFARKQAIHPNILLKNKNNL